MSSSTLTESSVGSSDTSSCYKLNENEETMFIKVSSNGSLNSFENSGQEQDTKVSETSESDLTAFNSNENEKMITDCIQSIMIKNKTTKSEHVENPNQSIKVM